MSRRRIPVVVALAAVVVVSGCGSEPLDLVDRTTSQAQDEETRLATLVSTHTWMKDPTCEVRLLRLEAATSWAWASCVAEDGGSSFPFRVDGDTVRRPDDDGVDYAEDVKELFPADLAEAILTSQEDFFP